VGLNVDEKTKRGAPRMGLKALAVRPAARQFFLAIEKKEKKEKKKNYRKEIWGGIWPAGPGLFNRKKTMGRQKLLYCT